MVTLEEVRNRISTAIHKHKKQVGEAIGVSPRQLNRYLDGSRGLSLETLIKISEATGVDICCFLGCKNGKLEDDEIRILSIYRELNEDGKKHIMECVENASEVSRYKKYANEALA